MVTVIGAGRIGTALALRSQGIGEPCALVRRGQPVPLGAAGDPVILAVRADDLANAIAQVPEPRHADVVTLQNGAIRERLAELGCADATRGLVYAMVAAVGELGTPGAPSVFTGRHAERVAGWFSALGWPAVAVAPAAFAEAELEKLLWLAVFGPLCEQHRATVGVVARDHRDQLGGLFTELAAVGRAAWGVVLDVPRAEQGLVSYALAIPDYRASVKEWPWRNGWLQDQARAHAVPTPIHDGLMRALGHPAAR